MEYGFGIILPEICYGFLGVVLMVFVAVALLCVAWLGGVLEGPRLGPQGYDSLYISSCTAYPMSHKEMHPPLKFTLTSFEAACFIFNYFIFLSIII